MKFLLGTVRPISLLAWIPVVVGACLAGSFNWGILFGSVGAILSVGWINSFNNVTDRRIDRLNPAKETLAATNPVKAYDVTLYILPGIAVMLRQLEYNNVLLAALFYLGYWYSYLFGRIPYLKRIVVAACVAGTSFMLAERYPPEFWMWVISAFAYILVRETRKDKADVLEDQERRFVYAKKVDGWCIAAPLLGAAIFLGTVGFVKRSLNPADFAIAFGITVAIWSYIQIRVKDGHYRMKFSHRTPAGRMGIVVALVGLMPAFASVPLLLVVWINSVSILYRSYLPSRFARQHLAIVHDAALWGSLPIIAACRIGVLTPSLMLAAGILFAGTITHQLMRRQVVSA